MSSRDGDRALDCHQARDCLGRCSDDLLSLFQNHCQRSARRNTQVPPHLSVETPLLVVQAVRAGGEVCFRPNRVLGIYL